jgi:hypothetical protein
MAATSLSDLRMKLKAFIEELPSHKRANSYRETLDAADFWDSAESWNRHLQLTGEVFRKRFDSATLTLIRDSDGSIKKELSETPFSLPLGLASCIELAEKRREILKQLDEFLDQTLFSQVIAVTQKDGNRLFVYEDYYKTSRDKFEKGTGSGEIEIIQTGEGAIRIVSLAGPLKIDREPASVVLAMQAELKTLHDSALADWDGVMLGWLARLPKSEGLDSTVGEIFTSQLLDRIRQGSVQKERLEKLSRSFIERRNAWGDWFRKGVRLTGPSTLLKQSVMPELAAIHRSRLDPQKELAAMHKLRVTPIGVWRVMADVGNDPLKIPSPIHYWRSVDPLQSGTVLTVRRDPNDPLKGQWVRLGQLERGNLRVSRTDVAMTAAQPIFLSQSLPTDLASDPYQKHNVAK